MKNSRNQVIGRQGEQAAADYLTQNKYEILGRNIRTPYGEIDILAKAEQTLVFIEVKTRTSKTFGNPENSITSQKLSHMEASASYYAQAMEYSGSWQWDVISIMKKDSNSLEIVHFENVIS